MREALRDSLAVAHDAGYRHGLAVGFAIGFALMLTAAAYAWLLHQELRRIRPRGAVKLVIWR